MAQIQVGGFTAWRHDEGDAYGYFNTFDALRLKGSGETPRKIHVLLPRDYENSTKKYPVLYVHDGETTFWPGVYGKTWAMQKTLSWGDNARQVQQVIIVAIRAINRIYEYTHAKISDNWPYGGLAEYTSYVCDYLKPFIDKNYRTNPDPSATGLTGSSGGGLATFYIAGARPDCFGLAACFSPALGAGLDMNNNLDMSRKLRDSDLIAVMKDNLKKKGTHPKFWFWWGLLRDGQFHNNCIEEHITVRGREMVQLLKEEYGYQEGQDLWVLEDQYGGHEEMYWVQKFMDFMVVFFPAK